MFIFNEYTGTQRLNFPSYILNRRENNETSEWILREGIPEKPLIEWVKQFMLPELDFIDIGAHMGSYTFNLAPLCRNVYSFEPQRTTFYQLCGGIVLNNLDNVAAYNVALSEQYESGTFKTLNVFSQDGGGSSLLGEVAKYRYGGNILSTEVVEVKSLDDYKYDRVGFIKIDAEGYEFEILSGAQYTIEKNRPGILFECWEEEWFESRKNKTFEFLRNLNYNIVTITNYPNMFLAAPV